MDVPGHGKLAGGIEEDLRSYDIGAHKRGRVMDAAIHMALSREVKQGSDAAADDAADRFPIGNVALDKAVARVLGQVNQVGQVAGVGQQIQVDKADIRLGLQKI